MRNFHFKDPVIIYSLEEKANGLLTCLMYGASVQSMSGKVRCEETADQEKINQICVPFQARSFGKLQKFQKEWCLLSQN